VPTDQRTPPQAPPRSRPARRRLLIGGVIGLAFLVLVVWWLRIPWAWSPVDDAGHVNSLAELMRANGTFSGMIEYVERNFRGDLDWGLFRPSYWVYPSLFYLLTPEWAHVVRLIMAFVAIGGPLLYFHREGLRGPQFVFAAALLIAASSSLYVGLFLVSLQELSGAALVGIGLASRNRYLRLVAWTLAAWFKSPFAWLLIGQAIVDWRNGKRTLAASNGALGVVTLGLATVMARQGGYTAGYQLDPFRIWNNLQVLLEPMNSLLLVALVWWILVTRSKLKLRNESWVFLIGWIGYTAQLLPWYVSAYYMGPISYLLGLFLISTLPTATKDLTTPRALFGLATPVVVALVLVFAPINQGFQIQNSMRTLQDCLQDRPGYTSVMQGYVIYVTSSPEGPIRLEQNLRLVDPSWTGSISLRDTESGEGLDPSIDLVLNVGPPPGEIEPTWTLECEGPNAQVFLVP